jgi:hypothetical protein
MDMVGGDSSPRVSASGKQQQQRLVWERTGQVGRVDPPRRLSAPSGLERAATRGGTEVGVAVPAGTRLSQLFSPCVAAATGTSFFFQLTSRDE